MENIIFLDTHAVVWLYSGKTELFSSVALEKLRKCELYISPIVKLELSYLFEIGKIKVNPVKVLIALNKEIGLKVSDDSFIEIVEETVKLSWTLDPFDRIITAQAILHNRQLITKDKTILSHCNLAIWD